MAILSRQDIINAFTRLGELALTQRTKIDLLLLGGAVMTLRFQVRKATRDVDVVIRSPELASTVRDFVKIIAHEQAWQEDWLNDAAKGFLVGTSDEITVFSAPGIEVRCPSLAQMLAMKLSAWRDELDFSDARFLLSQMPGNREQIWQQVVPHLLPGSELKIQYALEDLWESVHGRD